MLNRTLMSMLLILKRLLGQFLAPLPLITLIFLFGWMLRHAFRQRRLGIFVQVLSGVLFLAISVGTFDWALYRLEQTYPAFDPTPAHCGELRGSDIVVLGQGLDPDSTLPIRFRDNDVFRNRMIEAARIAHWVPGSRLLVSMAGTADPADKQAALDDYATLFNLTTNRLIMIDAGRDTESEARLALTLARTNTLIVVTSASHLPRAILHFERAAQASAIGITNTYHFIPAPTDYCALNPTPIFSWSRLPLPRNRACLNAERLLHETYGRLFEEIRSFPVVKKPL